MEINQKAQTLEPPITAKRSWSLCNATTGLAVPAQNLATVFVTYRLNDKCDSRVG